MEILNYINSIRKQIGLEEILPASDGICGRLTEEEISEYVGREKAEEIMGNHKREMEKKYLREGGWEYLQPIYIKGKAGLVLEEKGYMYTISEHRYLMVLMGKNYDLEMVMEKECIKRIAVAGEIDDYRKFIEENEEGIRKKKSIYKEYEYMGIERIGKMTGEYKKVVLRKKMTGEIVYYNGRDLKKLIGDSE